MLLTLGECHGNSQAGVRRYAEKFPNRRVPNRKTFVTTERRLRENGTVKPFHVNRGRNRTVRNVENEEAVLDMLHQNPNISTRRVGNQVQVSHSVVWRIA